MHADGTKRSRGRSQKIWMNCVNEDMLKRVKTMMTAASVKCVLYWLHLERQGQADYINKLYLAIIKLISSKWYSNEDQRGKYIFFVTWWLNQTQMDFLRIWYFSNWTYGKLGILRMLHFETVGYFTFKGVLALAGRYRDTFSATDLP